MQRQQARTTSFDNPIDEPSDRAYVDYRQFATAVDLVGTEQSPPSTASRPSEMQEPLATWVEFKEKVAARRIVFTGRETKVAEVALGDPMTIALGSVADVATRAGVSTTSVVRFAQRLGFGGYAECRRFFAAAVRETLRIRL